MASTALQMRSSENALVNLLFSASLTIHGAVSLTSDRQTVELLRAAIEDLDQSVATVRTLAFDRASTPVLEAVAASV